MPNLIKKLDLPSCSTDLCDFTVDEQNALSEAKGITVSSKPNNPLVGKTVNYIVAFVLVNDANEVLMMQESRESCREKWYLPAGRMEEGETIEQAAQREVLEETGLVVEITTLLMVESAGGSWFRFTLTGNQVGGELKCTPDSESLQAQWIRDPETLALRSQDVLGLISYAREYKTNYSVNIWPRDILPITKSHTKNYLRLICTIKRRKSNRFQLLYSERDESHFPLMEIHPERNLFSTLIKFLKVSAVKFLKRVNLINPDYPLYFRKSLDQTYQRTGLKGCYQWNTWRKHVIKATAQLTGYA